MFGHAPLREALSAIAVGNGIESHIARQDKPKDEGERGRESWAGVQLREVDGQQSTEYGRELED